MTTLIDTRRLSVPHGAYYIPGRAETHHLLTCSFPAEAIDRHDPTTWALLYQAHSTVARGRRQHGRERPVCPSVHAPCCPTHSAVPDR